jgi:type IV pilus assembly protein PilV
MTPMRTHPMGAIDSTPMKRTACLPVSREQCGFTMIEVLVTFVILVIGLLGLIGLQARGQQAELESYQRGQALVLLQDIIDRMNANRLQSKSGAYLTTGLTPAYVGNGATPPTALSDCTALTDAPRDLCEWGNELIGAAEITQGGACTTASGANCIGAMIGARGCVSYDATTELSDSTGAIIPGTGLLTIAVAWQGVAPLVAPPTAAVAGSALDCGKNTYPSEAQRRVVTTTLRMGSLTAQ